MSSKVRKGVVDKNLKVENTNNLYVLGSSVFSSGGHFNPTFTIVQLALRLANHLKILFKYLWNLNLSQRMWNFQRIKRN